MSVAAVAAVGGGLYLAGDGEDGVRLQRAEATEPSRTSSFEPQSVIATSMSSSGPNLRASSDDSMRVDFVVPVDRGTSTEPLRMHLVYTESSTKACSWKVNGAVMGSPDTGMDGGWRAPEENDHLGTIDVPAGDASTHSVIFRWPHQAEPGQLIQFALEREGTKATDTCDDVAVVAMELSY